MPREWHDRHAANQIENPEKRKFYRDIVADRKPYFMRYIYPALMKQYNTYIRNTNRNALREFQMTVDELAAIPKDQLTERQADFLRYYSVRMPVGMGDCVMNKICRRFEAEFDGYVCKANPAEKFDYTILKSDAEYSSAQFTAVKKLYDEYNKKLQGYTIFSYYERVDEDEAAAAISGIRAEFVRDCAQICQNDKIMCNIILDLCYRRATSKKFAWDICGDTIIENLLERNDWTISAPVVDPDGDMDYCGKRYSVISTRLEEMYEYCSE